MNRGVPRPPPYGREGPFDFDLTNAYSRPPSLDTDFGRRGAFVGGSFGRSAGGSLLETGFGGNRLDEVFFGKGREPDDGPAGFGTGRFEGDFGGSGSGAHAGFGGLGGFGGLRNGSGYGVRDPNGGGLNAGPRWARGAKVKGAGNMKKKIPALLPQKKLKEPPKEIWCKSCNLSVQGEQMMIQHLAGKKHNAMVVRLAEAKKAEKRKNEELKTTTAESKDSPGQKRKREVRKPMIGIAGNHYWCFPCCISSPNMKQLQVHLDGKKHEVKIINCGGPDAFAPLEELGPIPGPERKKAKTDEGTEAEESIVNIQTDELKPLTTMENNLFWCKCCEISCNRVEILEQHLKCKKHISKFNRLGGSEVFLPHVRFPVEPPENFRDLPENVTCLPECEMRPSYWCNLCELVFLTEKKLKTHLTSRKHEYNKASYGPNAAKITPMPARLGPAYGRGQASIGILGDELFCFLCGVELGKADVVEHLFGDDHESMISKGAEEEEEEEEEKGMEDEGKVLEEKGTRAEDGAEAAGDDLNGEKGEKISEVNDDVVIVE